VQDAVFEIIRQIFGKTGWQVEREYDIIDFEGRVFTVYAYACKIEKECFRQFVVCGRDRLGEGDREERIEAYSDWLQRVGVEIGVVFDGTDGEAVEEAPYANVRIWNRNSLRMSVATAKDKPAETKMSVLLRSYLKEKWSFLETSRNAIWFAAAVKREGFWKREVHLFVKAADVPTGGDDTQWEAFLERATRAGRRFAGTELLPCRAVPVICDAGALPEGFAQWARRKENLIRIVLVGEGK
jgi:hypothetical protein